ncbi:MAG: ankyrin repeat domain-containing protein [Phycisphaerales bacterium]
MKNKLSYSIIAVSMLVIIGAGAFQHFFVTAKVNEVQGKITDSNTTMAWYSDSPDKMRAAIQSGADVNFVSRSGKFDGHTPLMIVATRNDASEVIPILIEAGADISATDPMGLTALDHYRATDSPDPLILEMLTPEP